MPAGRSPRVRGRPRVEVFDEGSYGSIPAGAGETRSSSSSRAATRVDPRGCGGDRLQFTMIQIKMGRSPRVRGRRSLGADRLGVKRSIPAGAGETEFGDDSLIVARVDPRGCGGDILRRIVHAGSWGRSPRVRGRRSWGYFLPGKRGSIPAGAGETVIIDLDDKPEKVDPRGCGGDGARATASVVGAGRSPRVRGRL